MATAKNKRAPIKRSADNSLLDLASEFDLPQAEETAAEAPPAPVIAPDVPQLAPSAPAAKPAPARKPAKAKKPKGGDPYKGKAKIDAYATADVVAAIKYLAADDDRSQGYIVRKYLDIDGLLADARAAGFEAGE